MQQCFMLLAVSQAGQSDCCPCELLAASVLVPRLPERHSPLLVDSYTHEFKQQHKMVSSQILRLDSSVSLSYSCPSERIWWVGGVKREFDAAVTHPCCSHSLHRRIRNPY